MRTGGSVIFIQGRPHKAGAQTCLARLLAHEKIQRHNPVLVSSGEGWLTKECDRLGVRHIEIPFPSSRSLWARMAGNSRFAGDIMRRLHSIGITPSIVHANDHLEGLLALGLARAAGSKSALFLRSSGMTREDYFKYGCDRFDLVAAVGEALQEKAGAWDNKRDLLLIHDGLYPSEFRPVKNKPEAFPARLLIIGSTAPGKGWADVFEALRLLDKEYTLPPLGMDFAGESPDEGFKAKAGDMPDKVELRFLGRVDDLPGLARDYDLVINPSRSESFGMAALETVAAGVPVLSSRTGVIEQVVGLEHMLFKPHDPQSLAGALKGLMANWSEMDMGVADAQENIIKRFNIDNTVDRLVREYERLTNE